MKKTPNSATNRKKAINPNKRGTILLNKKGVFFLVKWFHFQGCLNIYAYQNTSQSYFPSFL
jgi:hypothetical protein